MSRQTKNPIKTDKGLIKVMEDVDNLESDQDFLFWRRSFFENYKQFVDPDGTANAEDADKRLFLELKDLTKAAMKVKMLTKDGNICDEQVTAEGRRAISNLNAEMKTVSQAIDNFMPKTWAHEEKVGYDKWELGGVLVKDGFRINEIMMKTRALILSLRDGPLEDVIEKNDLSIIKKYDESVQVFVDVMADLGLTNLVNKCIELYKETPRKPRKIKKPKENPPLSPTTDQSSPPPKKQGRIAPAEAPEVSSESEDEEPAVEVKKRSPAKPSAKARRKEEEEESSDEEEEEEENDDEDDGEGGEDIIFFDPKTGQLGKISRDFLEQKALIITMDEKGKDANIGVIEDEGEKVDLVWQLKKLERKLQEVKEETWLDKIKQEKAEKAAKEAEEAKARQSVAGAIGKDAVEEATEETKRAPVRMSKVEDVPVGFKGRKSTGKIRSSSSDARMKKKAAMARRATKKDDMAAASDHVSSFGKSGKVNDYGTVYKKKARKPSSSGWATVAPKHIDTKSRPSLL